MSRLDSFIRRMKAQRACLDRAASLIRAMPGNVLEFGLGNGRTYDHLRERLPHRDIFVFDRQMLAHPSCVPPPDHFFRGEVLETLPRAIAQLGANSALANVDIGTGEEDETRALVRAITPLMLQLLKPGAVVVSGGPLEHGQLIAMPLPAGIKPNRHFLYTRIDEAAIAALAGLHPANANQHRGRRYALVDRKRV